MRKMFAFLGLGFASLCVTPGVMAQDFDNLPDDILLTVDITTSNVTPNVATFTATGNAPVNNNTSRIFEGVFLDEFFSSNYNASDFGILRPVSLSPAGTGLLYSQYRKNFGDVGLTDINFYNVSGVQQRFTTDAAAFTGSTNATLPDAPFQSPGYTGDIFTLTRSREADTLLGRYIIVPEPTSAMLFAAAAAPCLIRRRRRV